MTENRMQALVLRAKAFERDNPRHEGEPWASYLCRLRQVIEAAEVQLELECEDCDPVQVEC